MKKINGHYIFIGICLIISISVGAHYGGNSGIMIFGMTCGTVYFYYWIYLMIRKSANDPRNQLLRQQEREYNTVIHATLIESGTTYKTKVGLGGAIVGGALFGLVGAIIGSEATQTIEPNTVQFLVEYKDGHTKIENVKIKSMRYKQLIRYM